MEYKLYKGDCLEIMDRLIEEGIKVDMILTDPPYGTIKNKWDSVIPFDKMWKRLNKLIKNNNCVIALFGNETFTSCLIKILDLHICYQSQYNFLMCNIF